MKKSLEKNVEKELEDKHYREKLEILQKSKEIAGKQLAIDAESGSLKVVDELKELINRQTEDPADKYDLYYNKIKNLMKKYLPKGKDFADERQIIYDEQNIFLNRGKAKNKAGKRGSDGRMDYNEDMGEMAAIVAEWLMTNLDPIELYTSIYALNEKYNYGHQHYDLTSRSFEKSMKKLSV